MVPRAQRPRGRVAECGHVKFVLKGWLGGFGNGGDKATVILDFYGGGLFLDDAAIGPVTNVDRHNQTKFLMKSSTGHVAVGVRQIYVLIRFDYADGSYNDGYADNLSLVLTGV